MCESDVKIIRFMRTCPFCGTENWSRAPEYFKQKGTHDADYFVICTKCGSPVVFWRKDIDE